jgi:predicted porin
MKKSVLALAILGAVAYQAHAQSSVTVYGIVDTGFSSIDNGADRTNGMTSGNNSASRVGFRGVENLGNGLNAEFKLENGINTDDGSGGSGFGRYAYVGLNGAFGKVRMGRQDNQISEALIKLDPFNAAGVGNVRNFVAGGGVPQRQPNMLTWLSNNYNGFSGSLGYIFGEVAGDNGANRGVGAQVSYENGPLNIQLAYQKQNYTGTANVLGFGGTGADLDDKTILLGATYNFSILKLHGFYGERKLDGAATVAAFGGATDISDKIRTGMIGVTVPFGASAIRADYIRNDNKDLNDADNSIWTMSYTYALSKRTTLYATYVRTDNDANSVMSISGPSASGFEAGENGNGAFAGINHRF